jgi:multidrug transporter EmrE-like cation transporter
MISEGWLFVVFAAFCTAAANLLLRAGILRAGGFSFSGAALGHQFLSLVNQPVFDIGVILYGVAALVWFRVLSVMEVSTSYPVLVSLTFALVTVGSLLLFKEQVSWLKLTGLGVILAGIAIVSRS